MKLSNIATTESLASIPSRRCIAGISEDLSAHGLCFDCLHHVDEADQTYGSDEGPAHLQHSLASTDRSRAR